LLQSSHAIARSRQEVSIWIRKHVGSFSSSSGTGATRNLRCGPAITSLSEVSRDKGQRMSNCAAIGGYEGNDTLDRE
jgi:hypothetical protein